MSALLNWQSNSIYKAQDGTHFTIIVSGALIESFTTCECCKAHTHHVFDKQGNSLCRQPCEHGPLVSLVDTSDATYSIKKKA